MSVNVKVSIVCAWYNRAEHICGTINSLLAQDYDSFEVIVVNDGSSDPKVKELLDSYSDFRLKVIHQENRGFTKAIKVAIKMAGGEFLAIQGAGDISSPSRIRKQAQMLVDNPEAGIVGCHYIKRNLTQNSSETIEPKGLPAGNRDHEFSDKLIVSHGELMYRRSIYERAGGYRDFFVVGQGTDLWGRMLRHAALVIVPEVLYEQKIFEDGVSTNYLKVFHRSLLHGIMLEERRAVASGVKPLIQDPEGIFISLYLASRKEISKRYLTVVVICYALRLPESEEYRAIAIANSNALFSFAAWLFRYIPFKRIWARRVACRSVIYTRLIRDVNIVR